MKDNSELWIVIVNRQKQFGAGMTINCNYLSQKIRMKQIISSILILGIAILCTLATAAQNKDIFIAPRISFQSDFQKAAFKDIRFPFEFKEHTATQVNWGIDLLIEKSLSDRLSVYIGAGYFRNKFNFKRQYDHQLLNDGRDSIPIGTSTNNYIFHLLHFPIGANYQVLKRNKYDFILGIENVVNFSFQQVYNGKKAFPEARNKHNGFNYYGNTILLFAGISKHLSHSSLFQFGPYLRLLNIYKRKDLFLYESNHKPYIRTFDAIGLSLKYAFNCKQ